MNDMNDMREKAIGVFDSGVGGLTVLSALHRLLPWEKTAYLGDTARVPYGPRSPEVIVRYSMDNARFLMSQNLKLLVVACNTASAVALDVLKKALPIPVIGVIEPGARAAAEATHTGKIGIIGTRGTVKSGAYQSAIWRLKRGVEIRAVPCPLFVALAEEGWTTGEIAEGAAREYFRAFQGFEMDTLVLGCTHYPLLKGAIAEVLGPSVRLVEPAEATAKSVAALLRERGWDAPLPHDTGSRKTAERLYFVTDQPEQFSEVGERFLGERIDSIQCIQLPDA